MANINVHYSGPSPKRHLDGYKAANGDGVIDRNQSIAIDETRGDVLTADGSFTEEA